MATPRRPPALVTALAIVYVVLLSSTFVAIKVGLRYWPPMMLAATRFLLAAATLGVLARWLRLAWPSGRRAWVRLVVLGALNMMLPACFNFLALRNVSAGMAAIVLSTNPLLLTLLAPRLLGERLTTSRAIGLLFGFGGVVYVMSVRVGAGGRADTPVGVALLCAAALSMVAGTLFFKRYPPRENPLIINTVQQAISGVGLIPLMLLTENPLRIVIRGPLVVALLYMVFVVSVGAGILWFWLLAHGEASAVSSFYFLSPISGVILGALFVGDRVGVREIIGLGVVSIGIVLIGRRSSSRPRAGAEVRPAPRAPRLTP